MDQAKIKNALKLQIHKVRPYSSTVFFIVGFVFDIFTLGRIDDTFNIISQLIYISALFILLFKDLFPIKFQEKVNLIKPDWHPEVIQFLLGALLSAYTIFYFKSASLSTSILFLFIMSLLMLINELKLVDFIDRYLRICLFHLCLITFLFILTPIITGSLSAGDFAFGIGLNLLIYLFSFKFFTREQTQRENVLKVFLYPGLSVVFFFVFLYLVNILPPLPLALKNISIHHAIEKENGQYRVSYDFPKWKFWKDGSSPFYAITGDKPHIFASVFAPRNFDGKIYLHWQIFKDGNWRTSDRIPLNIKGGREEGFRGFSFKNNWQIGEWRILVESEDKRVIGKFYFDIESGQDAQDRLFRYEYL